MNALIPFASLALATSIAPLVAGAPPAQPSPAAVSIPVCEEAYLGVYVIQSSAGGAEVTRIMDGSPADKAGIRGGDRIVALAGHQIDDPETLIAMIDDREAGNRVEVVFYRGSDKHTKTVKLGNRAEAQRYFEVDAPADVSRGFFQPGEFEFEEFEVPAFEEALSFEFDQDSFDVFDEDGGSVIVFEDYEVEMPFEVQQSRDDLDVELSARRARDMDETSARLEERMEALRAQMEVRFAGLAERLEELRQSRSEGDFRERMTRYQEELSRDQAVQKQRFEDVRAKMHAAEEERRAQMAEAYQRILGEQFSEQRRKAEREGVAEYTERLPRVRSPIVVRERVEAPEWIAPPTRTRPDVVIEQRGQSEIQALRDEVSSLRDEIRELRELLARDR